MFLRFVISGSLVRIRQEALQRKTGVSQDACLFIYKQIKAHLPLTKKKFLKKSHRLDL